MPKPRRNPNPLEQYDRFMFGGKTPASFRGLVHVTGAFVGNSLLWLTGLITVARLGMVLAFFLAAAVTIGVLQRFAPALDLTALFAVGGLVGVIVVAVGAALLKGILRRDAQRIGNKPTFGVYDEDMRKFRANRRKSRR